jgi:serine/threonine-protein kinase
VIAPLRRSAVHELLRVRDRKLGRVAVAKLLRAELGEDPVLGRRLLREARLIAWLHQEGIVAVHEAGRLSDGRYYFLMSDVDGPSLAHLIGQASRGAGEQAMPRMVRVLIDAARVVGGVHRRGVIHGDLRPSSILLSQDGEAKVVDWAMARACSDGAPEWLRDTSAVDVAVPGGAGAVAAPELLRSDLGEPGPALDVYALGTILHTVLGVCADAEEGEVHSVVGSPALAKVRSRARSSRPADRFRDAGEFAEALASAAGSLRMRG